MKKLLMALALLPLMAAAETEIVNDVEWTFFIKDGKVQVGSWNYPAVSYEVIGAITIPSFLGGCPVTSIGDHAFQYRSALTAVVIPKGVTSIGEGAFWGCSGLTSVTIPEGVECIGDYAFHECGGLKEVTIPKGVTSIGNSVFFGCSELTSVTIPIGVTNIGDYAFYKCGALTSVVLPEGVGRIGDSAFYECSGLVSVGIPSSVASIGEYAFRDCWGLTSVDIPKSLTSISNYTFWGCSGLTSITIPSNVTNIGAWAFEGCNGLTSVMIPSSVTSIGASAFYCCMGLTSVVIQSGVMSIEGAAFYSCAKLASVTIPASVTSIGWCAFEGCHSLTTVHVGGNGDVDMVKRMVSESGFAVERVVFDYVTYKISFLACGGVSSRALIEVRDGYPIAELPTAERKGYEFLGWFTAVSGGMKVFEEMVVEKDVTCYAQWAANEYTVRFDANGGTGTMEPQGFIYDEAGKLKANAFAREDYTFVGWTIARGDTSSRVYADGEVVSNLTVEADGVVTLYALWKSNECYIVPGEAVSIDTGLIGYTAKGLPSGLRYDKTTGMITGAATRPTAAEGVIVKFTKTGEPDAERTIVVGPLPTIGVALEGDTDGCKVTGAGAYLVGKKVTLKVTTKKGTAFAGFYKDGEPWPNEADCKKTSLAYTMGKDDVSLVAKFEKEKMSVGCVGLSDGSFTAGVAGSPEGIPLEIETQSGIKSVKVEKLPAGMKYDAKKERIIGAPTKAGDNTVVITVTAFTCT